MDTRSEVVTLIRQFQTGNTDSFNDIYEKTYKLIYTTCYGILRSQEDAEDVAQDTFITIYEKLSLLQTPETYASWMIRVATNKSIDYCRHSRYITYTDNDAELDICSDDWNEVDGLPDSFIEDEEKREIINKVLKESLSEVQYQTLFMHYFNNMPVEDIATAMECPEGTVKTRLKSARAKFKDALEGYLDDNKLVLGAVPFLTRFFTSQVNEGFTPGQVHPPFSNIPADASPAVSTGALTATGTAANAGAKTGILSTIAGKIAVGSIALAGVAAIGVGGYFLLIHKNPEVINLNDYVIYSVNGSNGYAELNYTIDYQSLINSNPGLKDVSADKLQTLLKGKWNKTESISNGDELVFTWADTSDIAIFEKDNNIDFEYSNIIYTADGLIQLKEIDLFDYVEVSFAGADGDGVASITVKDDIPVKGITFEISDKNSLRNGCAVEVTAIAPDNHDLFEYLRQNGFNSNVSNKRYTVDNLENRFAVTDALRLSYEAPGGGNCVYAIPQISLYGVDTSNINKQIYDRYTLPKDGNKYASIPRSYEEFLESYWYSYRVDYSYYYTDTVISIVIEQTDEDNYCARSIINIDISSGEIITSAKEFLSIIQKDPDAFYSEALSIVTAKSNYYEEQLVDYGYIYDQYAKDAFKQNTLKKNIYKIQPFIGKDGHLCFEYPHFYTAVDAEWYDTIFDYVTGDYCIAWVTDN